MKKAATGFALLLCMTIVSGAHATTFYVANEGNDSNNGTSPDTPWATLVPVNSSVFQPGDKILLRRGSVWQGILIPCTATHCSGTAAAPIQIGSYDVGTVRHLPPRIDGAGSGRATIMLVNQSYWEISSLDITNTGPPGFHYAGVMAVCDSPDPAQRVCHHLTIAHNSIRDVNGDVNSYFDGGIVIEQNSNSARLVNGSWVSNSNSWDDVLIEQNQIRRTSRVGILMADMENQPPDPTCPGGNRSCSMNRPLSTNVRIRNNGLTAISGDGMLLIYTDGAVIEHNVLGNWGTLGGPPVAGLWTAGTRNTKIQYNEVFGAVCGQDRMAFDIDWGNISDYVQYNYSHNNCGGMIGFFDDYAPGTPNDIIIDDPIVRFNISVNDGTVDPTDGVVNTCGEHGFSLGLNPLDFANNVIYQSATNYFTRGPNVIQIFHRCLGPVGNITSGSCDDPSYTGPEIDGSAWIYNNIFYVEGHATYPKFNGAGFGDNTFYSPNIAPTCEPTDGGKSTANPMFASFPAAPVVPNDFKLKTGSPALATGMYTTSLEPTDYFGNAITNPPNRGVYNGPGLP